MRNWLQIALFIALLVGGAAMLLFSREPEWSSSSSEALLEFERQAAAAGGLLQHADRLRHDLGADAVAGHVGIFVQGAAAAGPATAAANAAAAGRLVAKAADADAAALIDVLEWPVPKASYSLSLRLGKPARPFFWRSDDMRCRRSVRILCG